MTNGEIGPKLTVRRDLRALESEGRLLRPRGGAMLEEEREPSYLDKARVAAAEKAAIAAAAVTLVDEGDVRVPKRQAAAAGYWPPRAVAAERSHVPKGQKEHAALEQRRLPAVLARPPAKLSATREDAESLGRLAANKTNDSGGN